MAICQLCEVRDVVDGEDWCPEHGVPLAQGSGRSLRFAYQPWSYLEEECEWADSDDIWTAYSAGGATMDELSEWRCPNPIPNQIAALEDSEVISNAYFWVWSVRRSLWRDLIGQQILTARLHHYPDWREGQGPTLWLSGTESAPVEDPFVWSSTDASVVLQADTWPRSDLLYTYSQLWDSPTLPLIERHYEEFDHDKHEYSFEIEFEVGSGPDPDPLPPWSSLPSDEQSACVEDLLQLRSAADALWVEDLLACIPFHPGTPTNVLLESGILEVLIAREAVLRSTTVDDTVKALAAIRRD